MTHEAHSTAGPVGPDLLGRLLDQHAAALALYARQWSSSPEDVVQEALVELARQPQTPPDPVAWLYRVVRHRALSAVRSARRRQRHESAAAGQRAAWFTAAAADALDAQAVSQALAGLRDEHREVIVAHLWGQLTFVQIAQVMGTSASTAHRHYTAALAALRERLGVPCPKSP